MQIARGPRIAYKGRELRYPTTNDTAGSLAPKAGWSPLAFMSKWLNRKRGRSTEP